jgi:hypothetical protein
VKAAVPTGFGYCLGNVIGVEGIVQSLRSSLNLHHAGKIQQYISYHREFGILYAIDTDGIHLCTLSACLHARLGHGRFTQ